MRILKSFIILSLLFLTACSDNLSREKFEPDDINEAIETTEESEEYDQFPNAVRVLREGAELVSLPETELLDIDYMLDILSGSTNFPGVHLVSRRFTEQMVNTLLSLGHIIIVECITDIFMYLHMEWGNYTYLVWWSNNQLMLTGDFVIIRESFLR